MSAVLFLRAILVVAMCCFGLGFGAGVAAADGGKLALLPLDAPGKLAIYGQPVAAEIARALTEAGLDVVVVGAQMAVPREAVLVIDGSLISVRKRVKIELRLRALDSRKPLATAKSSESPLEKLDQAAGEVAAELLPQVQAELDSRRSGQTNGGSGKPAVTPVLEQGKPVQAPLPTAIVAVAASAVSSELRPLFIERLQVAAGRELSLGEWDLKKVTLREVSAASMMGVAATLPSELSLAFDVRGLSLSQKAVFVGSVQARLVVTLRNEIVFDRTVTTDTVVGARKGTVEAMVDLLAREVVTILRPRYARYLAARKTAASSAASGPDATHAAR